MSFSARSLILVLCTVCTVVVLFLISPTIDESLRCSLFQSETKIIINQNWPPLTLVPSLLLSELSLPNCYIAVRFITLLLLVIFFINHLSNHTLGVVEMTFLAPYFLATMVLSVPQALTFISLYYYIVSKSNFGKYLSALVGIYSNPICFPIIVIGELVRSIYSRTKAPAVLLLIFLSLVLASAYNYSISGNSSPFFSENGFINLLLGNNPHPYSYLGYIDESLWSEINRIDNPKRPIDYLLQFVISDPIGFLSNFSKKLLYYFLPFRDYKSKGLQGYNSIVLQMYFFAAEIYIYYSFFKAKKTTDLDFTLILFITAWLCYSLFSISFRYKVPFDLLLFLMSRKKL